MLGTYHFNERTVRDLLTKKMRLWDFKRKKMRKALFVPTEKFLELWVTPLELSLLSSKESDIFNTAGSLYPILKHFDAVSFLKRFSDSMSVLNFTRYLDELDQQLRLYAEKQKDVIALRRAVGNTSLKTIGKADLRTVHSAIDKLTPEEILNCLWEMVRVDLILRYAMKGAVDLPPTVQQKLKTQLEQLGIPMALDHLCKTCGLEPNVRRILKTAYSAIQSLQKVLSVCNQTQSALCQQLIEHYQDVGFNVSRDPEWVKKQDALLSQASSASRERQPFYYHGFTPVYEWPVASPLPPTPRNSTTFANGAPGVLNPLGAVSVPKTSLYEL